MGRAEVLSQRSAQQAQAKAWNYQAGVTAYYADALYAAKLGLTRDELQEQRARADYIEGRIDIEAFEQRIGYEGTFR